MKKIKLRFEINGSIYIQKEAEKNLPFKTINEMREYYAKLHEKEQSENVSHK